MTIKKITFILDTSSLIDDVNLLTKIKKTNNKIIIPEKVYYELKYLEKKGGPVGHKATIALRELDFYIQYSSVNNFNPRLLVTKDTEQERKSLSKMLHLDFTDQTVGNDNQILANAFRNPTLSILISSDKKLKHLAKRRRILCFETFEEALNQAQT